MSSSPARSPKRRDDGNRSPKKQRSNSAPKKELTREEKLEREIAQLDSKRRDVNSRLRMIDGKGGKGLKGGKGFDRDRRYDPREDRRREERPVYSPRGERRGRDDEPRGGRGDRRSPPRSPTRKRAREGDDDDEPASKASPDPIEPC
jgi:hypothetical protein